MNSRKRDDAVSDVFVRERQRERLGVMTALVRALDRRDEVLAAVASAENDDAAQRAIVTLLELQEPLHAVAVLDMELRRWTVPNRERIRAGCDDLRAALDQRQ